KFDYIDGIPQRKHIIVDRVRYIGKESNNLDDASVLGIDPEDYLEFENPEQFYDWVLSLRPEDVRDKGISERGLNRKKAEIRKGHPMNPKTRLTKVVIRLYDSTRPKH
ncbi:MAG: hypothetical protein QW613_06335, partial [Thermoprotei archaeon]